MNVKQRCIGCWFSTKKKKKVNIGKLQELIENQGFKLKEIDFTKTLEEQGPFVAIIHKMTDRMIEAMDGDKRAEENMKDVENYLRKRPHIVVVDPLCSMRKLLDRYETYKLIQSTRICCTGKLQVPTFIPITCKDELSIIEQMKKHKVEFPFVCKKSVAHGSASHKMSVIFNKEGLKDVDPPCVAQTFINHGALLYKIYVIADKYHVVKRPSLRNFSKHNLKDHKTIFFNSHDISSGECSRSSLTTLDSEDLTTEHAVLDRSLVDLLTKELHSELKMTMYGVDIIVDPETRSHFVIDVNVFPGYDGVPDFLDTLVDYIMEKLVTSTNGNAQEFPPIHKQVESGTMILNGKTSRLVDSEFCLSNGEPTKKIPKCTDGIPVSTKR